MVRPGRNNLSGTLEIDETYIGGERSGKRGRGAKNKPLVAVAVEDTSGETEGGIGRIRLQCVGDASSNSLLGFIKTHVCIGSEIRTDGWSSYTALPTVGYGHTVVESKDLTIVHLVISLLKRWLLGTYQGAVRSNHLPYYLDEFTFRFNRRTSGNPNSLRG